MADHVLAREHFPITSAQMLLRRSLLLFWGHELLIHAEINRDFCRRILKWWGGVTWLTGVAARLQAEQREARSKKELLTVLSTQWTGGASRPLSAAHPRNSTGWQARDSAGGGNPRRPVTSSTLRSSSGEAIVWAHGETPSWSGGFLDPHTGGWEELGRPNGAHARQSLSRDSRDRGRAPSVAPGGSIGAGGARDSNKGGERSKSVVFRMEEELVRDGTLENAGRNRKTNPRVQDPPQQHPIRDAPAQEEGLFSALDRFAGSIGSIDFGKW